MTLRGLLSELLASAGRVVSDVRRGTVTDFLRSFNPDTREAYTETIELPGGRRIDVPRASLKADSAIYADKIRFRMECRMDIDDEGSIRINTVDRKANLYIDIRLEAGDIPEGEALVRDELNQILNARING